MQTLQAWLNPSLLLALGYLAIVATAAIVAALRIGGRREDTVDHNDALSLSRFTIPVSVIVPASHDERGISGTVAALLELNYPEFEVIAVIESASASFEAFSRDWRLEAREYFYRQAIETAPVRRIYRSARDPRLVVVDKAAFGYADAVNCGVNMARYRYTLAVPTEILFDANALLRIMSAPLRNPATVLGASNHVEESGVFEQLASARSLMASRVVWRDESNSLGPAPGGVTVWRRDVVLDAKGFSLQAVDPDLDMARRTMLPNEEPFGGHFRRGSDVFGRRPASPLLRAVTTSVRRQLAVLRCIGLVTPSGVRALGARSLAGFFGAEIITPLAQAWVVVALLINLAAGSISLGTMGLALLLLSFGHAAVTTSALLMRGASAGSPDGPELVALLLAGPVELVLYRPIRLVAALVGVLRHIGSPAKRPLKG